MKSKIMFAALTGLVLASQANAADNGTKSKTPDTSTAMGECHGMNTCKGKGECAGQGHSCHAMNTCKGKGWVTLNEADCKAKKGQWKAAGSAMSEPAPAPAPSIQGAPAKTPAKNETKPTKQ